MKNPDVLPRKLTNHQLYALLKNGHPMSLEYIYYRYKRLLFWLGKQMLEDDFAVETLVQDVFLKLWLHRGSIETPNHIPGFLRFVMKRDCISYFHSPKNKFARLTASLERFENYQDYLHGYDPQKDREHLIRQDADQKDFDEVKKVLKLLDPKRRYLLELCLQYGFKHKPIAEAMGSSVTGISNEVRKAIDDVRKILTSGSSESSHSKAVGTGGQHAKLNSQQIEILKRRLENKCAFRIIAQELKLSEKEVHRQFLYAYEFTQRQQASAITH